MGGLEEIIQVKGLHRAWNVVATSSSPFLSKQHFMLQGSDPEPPPGSLPSTEFRPVLGALFLQRAHESLEAELVCSSPCSQEPLLQAENTMDVDKVAALILAPSPHPRPVNLASPPDFPAPCLVSS